MVRVCFARRVSLKGGVRNVESKQPNQTTIPNSKRLRIKHKNQQRPSNTFDFSEIRSELTYKFRAVLADPQSACPQGGYEQFGLKRCRPILALYEVNDFFIHFGQGAACVLRKGPLIAQIGFQASNLIRSDLPEPCLERLRLLRNRIGTDLQ